MKKPLIAAIATVALAAGAQAESKFYGKMNVSLHHSDVDPELSLNSNASRLGVDGDDSTKVITQRDAYIGLAYSGMGTVKMGIMDTPLKKSQGKFDLFNDVVDIKNVITGENRIADSLNYTSEKMGPVQVSVSYIMKEDDTMDDGISASVVFKQGDLYASVAMDDKTKSENTATQRATVIYSLGDIRLGALVNIVDDSDTADEDMAYAVNGSFKMGKNTIKVQYEAGDQGKAQAPGATVVTAGVDHKLGKATKAFALVNMGDADAPNSDSTTVAFGLEHKF